MKAVEWRGKETLRIASRPEPRAEPGQAVVEVAACGICGSDLHSYRQGLGAEPGQVLGHEFVGAVIAAPGVDGLAMGTRVAVRPLIPCGSCPACSAGEPQRCTDPDPPNIGYRSPGAFAERVLVPRAVVGETVFPLPEQVSDRAGALIEPLAVSLHAVVRANPRPDDSILVLGAGTIGLGVTRLLGLHGAHRVAVAEISALRRDRALRLGAERVIDPACEEVERTMREVDVVIDCAGAELGVTTALKVLRRGGTFVLAAIFGRKVAVNLNRVVEKEIELRGSYAYQGEFSTVIDLLSRGQVDPEQFVTHEFGLDDITDAFQVQLDPERSVKVLVLP